ncbi:putative zinc-finger of transcription factor IIIC complex-domain-containing protein, partial [Amylostereum chailletii]
LQTQKLSAGCSSIHPVSGIQYVAEIDTLVLSLYDGSFHTIYSISSGPSLDPPSGVDTVSLPTSSSLSALSRAIFHRSENKPVRRVDMNRIDGMVSYDAARAFLWVYQNMCPSDFSYKSDAKLTSILVVADMWEDATGEAVLRTMHRVFGETKTTLERSPIDLLRPLFLRLCDETTIAALFPHVMSTLQGPYHQIQTPSFPVVEGAVSPGFRRDVRGSLARHLLGCETLFSLRLKLAIADFCWKHAPNPHAQNECGAVAQGILTAISQCIHRVLVGHLSSVSGKLTGRDMPFVLRIVLQCLLPGTPEDLSTAAQTLSNNASASARANAGDGPTNELEENCPACGLAVPLDNITGAVCPNGHTWSRCSITSFILSTPKVRTCLGCSRKAFLPPM